MLSRCSGSCVFVRASCAHTSRRTANSELTLACATTGTGTGADSLLSTLDILRPCGSPGLAPCPVGRLRGVIGPDPRPLLMWSEILRVRAWSIHSARAAHPGRGIGLAWTGRSAGRGIRVSGGARRPVRTAPPERPRTQARSRRRASVACKHSMSSSGACGLGAGARAGARRDARGGATSCCRRWTRCSRAARA